MNEWINIYRFWMSFDLDEYDKNIMIFLVRNFNDYLFLYFLFSQNSSLLDLSFGNLVPFTKIKLNAKWLDEWLVFMAPNPAARCCVFVHIGDETGGCFYLAMLSKVILKFIKYLFVCISLFGVCFLFAKMPPLTRHWPSKMTQVLHRSVTGQ